MRTLFAAMLLVATTAGQARAQAGEDGAFCTTLRHLLKAAWERPAAFASLGRHGPARAAAALGYDSCRIEPGLWGGRFICRLAASPAPQEERVAICLPEALRMAEPEGSPIARFRLGTRAVIVERRPGFSLLSLFPVPVHR